MATSLEPQTSQQYVDFDEYIDFQLQKTRSNIRLTDLLTAGAGVATLIFGYLLVFVVLDHWVVPGGFGFLSRVLMLSGLLIASGVWILWKVFLPYIRRVNRLYAARLIEQSEPTLKGSLLNLIDLRGAGRSIPAAVETSLEKRAAVTLSHMDVDEAVDRRPLMWSMYALLAVVILCCLYTLVSPKRISNSVYRALFPASELSVATRTEIRDVKPGDTEVLAGTQMEIVADLRGDIPERVTLLYTTADRRFVDEPVAMRRAEEEQKQYRGLLNGENGRGILQEMTYRIEAGDAKTRDYRVAVSQPPSAGVDRVQYVFPRYMQLEPKTQPIGHIDAWEGTKVTVTATANMPLKAAVLVFSDTEQSDLKAEEVRMDVSEGTHLSASWKLAFRSDGTYPRFYHIQCKNQKGETDPDPALYNLTIRPDQAPEIDLLDPVGDLEMPANAVVTLLFQARDPDFLLRFVTLRVEKDGELIHNQPIFDGFKQSYSGTHDFQLERLNLRAGQKINFWLEARDNKQPLGNRKNTPKHEIRIVDAVSKQEVQEQLEADKQRQREKLQTAEQDTTPDREPEEQSQDTKDATEQDDTKQPGGQTQPQPSEAKSPKPEQGSKGERKESSEASESEQSGGSPGKEKQRLRNDGSDDDEVLRRLQKHQQKQKSDGSDQPQDAQPDGNQSGKQPSPDGQQKPKDVQQSPQRNTEHEEPDGTKQPKKSEKSNPHAKQQADANKPGDGGEKKQPQSDGQQPTKPDNEKGNKDSPGSKDGRGKKAAERGSDKAESGPTPGESKSKTQQSQPGKGTEDSDSKPGEKGKQPDKQLNSRERPTDDQSPAARHKKATGDEKGKGAADKDPKDPTQAKNKLKRKEGESPAARNRDAQADRNDSDGSKKGSRNPGKADHAKQTQQHKQQNPDQRPTQPKEGEASKPSAKPDDQPDRGNDRLKGKGRPQGQQSKQPEGGEGGSSKKSDQGNSGSNKPGAGDTAQQPGARDPSKQPSGGKAGGQTGAGSKTKPTEKRGADTAGQSDSKRKNSAGKGKGQSSAKGSGKSSDRADGGAGGGKKGGSPHDPGGNARGGQPSRDATVGSGGTGGAEAGENANLEYAKKAANLVLKRLEDEIQRGEVDQDLLDRLGWTKRDIRKFAERFRRQLDDSSADDSPESEARRRQFEEMLKSLDLGSDPRSRSGSDVRRRLPSRGIGPRRLPVPAEYREAYEAYTRSLSKWKQRTKP